MIITETQISIQRSSSWAINYLRSQLRTHRYQIFPIPVPRLFSDTKFYRYRFRYQIFPIPPEKMKNSRYWYLYGPGTHYKSSKFLNFGDETQFRYKIFRYRFRYFFPVPNLSDTGSDTIFRYQFFPILVPIPSKKWPIPGTGTSHLHRTLSFPSSRWFCNLNVVVVTMWQFPRCCRWRCQPSTAASLFFSVSLTLQALVLLQLYFKAFSSMADKIELNLFLSVALDWTAYINHTIIQLGKPLIFLIIHHCWSNLDSVQKFWLKLKRVGLCTEFLRP